MAMVLSMTLNLGILGLSKKRNSVLDRLRLFSMLQLYNFL